jgi:ubiquinone/menaquinone biosynthesis C-methylase UbiE
LLHALIVDPAGTRVLEAGCGVGAQTIILAKNSPEASITSIDISKTSVQEAEQRVLSAGFTNVRFQQADIFDLPEELDSFDHIFVCFVLEHLSEPMKALQMLKKRLKLEMQKRYGCVSRSIFFFCR